MLPQSSSVLTVSDLSFAIDNRNVLESINLTLTRGESLSISGPSGSGKSTLLSCIAGLTKPDSGMVNLNGETLTRLSRKRLTRHRSKSIGIVFQFGELLPELTPIENVAIAAMLAGTPSSIAFSSADSILRELQVPDAPHTASLSGGERQRVAVARALINQPPVILADEPTGALDHKARNQVAELLFDLPARWQCGLIVVTHDSAVASMAQRHYVLSDGTLELVPEISLQEQK
ncbi:ABC transporter ATP-binding protein [Streptomyces sp. NPDC050698]